MFIVQNEETFNAAIEFIKGNELLAFDVETTGLNVRRDTVIGFGVSNAYGGFYAPIFKYDAATGSLVSVSNIDFINSILVELQNKQIITFNASFDLRITKNNLGYDLLPNLHTDVLLLKHTCDEEFPFGLKEIAVKLFGLDVKKEKEEMLANIRAKNGTVTEYYKANMELLAKYCVQDCLLTFKLYNYYLPKLKERNQVQFFYDDEVMPLYKKVTIPMESAGVRLDLDALQKASSEIRLDIDALEAQIQGAISPLLGSVFMPWFLNKDYPLQTATGKVPAWAKKFKTQYDAWQAEGERYIFNLQSKHHLKKLFFDTLKEIPTSTTELGNPQVDEEFLELMSQKYDWCTKLIEFNKLNKLHSTYIQRLLDEQEDGRFYPSFMQHRTVSGRYAGDMQQLPRPIEGDGLVAKYTNKIREFIIADKDSVLMSADYEQLEPSIFAHVSGDDALQNIFKNGTDFYSEICIRTEGLKGYSSDKKADNYLGKLNKQARQNAKAYALGIPYGLSGYKLQFEIGVSQNEAENLVGNYLRAFPKLASWMEHTRAQVHKTGYIESQLGRRRTLQRVPILYAKYGPNISDSLLLWKSYNNIPSLYAQARKDRKEYINLVNNANNFQIQSLAASIMNRACISIIDNLNKNSLKAQIVGQIHDEVLLNVPKSEIDQVAKIVKECMESVIELSVPLRTTPQTGINFRQCK